MTADHRSKQKVGEGGVKADGVIRHAPKQQSSSAVAAAHMLRRSVSVYLPKHPAVLRPHIPSPWHPCQYIVRARRKEEKRFGTKYHGRQRWSL